MEESELITIKESLEEQGVKLFLLFEDTTYGQKLFNIANDAVLKQERLEEEVQEKEKKKKEIEKLEKEAQELERTLTKTIKRLKKLKNGV